MGEVMEPTQEDLRQTIRDVIAKYRRGAIHLSDLINELNPRIEKVQPEEVWEDADELFTELDAYYGLLATGEAVQRHGHDFPLSSDQRANVDRILENIEGLLG